MDLGQDTQGFSFSYAPRLYSFLTSTFCQTNKRLCLKFLGGAFLFTGRGRKETPPWKAILWERSSANLTETLGLRAIYLKAARMPGFTRATDCAGLSTIFSLLPWENSKRRGSTLTGRKYPNDTEGGGRETLVLGRNPGKQSRRPLPHPSWKQKSLHTGHPRKPMRG